MPKGVKTDFKNDEYYQKTNRPTTKQAKPAETIIDFGGIGANVNEIHSKAEKEPVRVHLVKETVTVHAEKRAPSEPKSEFNINNIDLDNIISHIKDTSTDHRGTSNSAPKTNHVNPDAFNIIDYVNSKPTEEKIHHQQNTQKNDDMKNDLFGIWNSVPTSSSVNSGVPNPNAYNSSGSTGGSSTTKPNPSGNKIPLTIGFDLGDIFKSGISTESSSANNNNSSTPNIHKINVKSNKAIDNVPDHLDTDTMNEKVDKIIKVSNPITP
jgi:hypothetical protein